MKIYYKLELINSVHNYNKRYIILVKLDKLGSVHYLQEGPGLVSSEKLHDPPVQSIKSYTTLYCQCIFVHNPPNKHPGNDQVI